ncbi:MAG: GNAT family N-acetyltransferase [Oscillospiraceae bacterium]|nr:GNAT family N-acetyltransferase [Oscillospiraceae bacterium]
MNAIIRDANNDDYEAVYNLNLTGLGYDFPIEETKKRLAQVLEKPNVKLLVAEIDGSVAGYIHAVDYDCLYHNSLKNILALVVDGRFRGKGVGRQLLSAVEDWAKYDGACGVRLVSGMDRTGAHSFYKSCGYSLRKDQRNFIKVFV